LGARATNAAAAAIAVAAALDDARERAHTQISARLILRNGATAKLARHYVRITTYNKRALDRERGLVSLKLSERRERQFTLRGERCCQRETIWKLSHSTSYEWS